MLHCAWHCLVGYIIGFPPPLFFHTHIQQQAFSKLAKKHENDLFVLWPEDMKRNEHLNNLELHAMSPDDFEEFMSAAKGTDPSTRLPPWLQDMTDCFKNKKEFTLKRHQAGVDHAINLKPGMEALYKKAYAMNPDQLAAVKKYIDELNTLFLVIVICPEGRLGGFLLEETSTSLSELARQDVKMNKQQEKIQEVLRELSNRKRSIGNHVMIARTIAAQGDTYVDKSEICRPMDRNAYPDRQCYKCQGMGHLADNPACKGKQIHSRLEQRQANDSRDGGNADRVWTQKDDPSGITAGKGEDLALGWGASPDPTEAGLISRSNLHYDFPTEKGAPWYNRWKSYFKRCTRSLGPHGPTTRTNVCRLPFTLPPRLRCTGPFSFHQPQATVRSQQHMACPPPPMAWPNPRVVSRLREEMSGFKHPPGKRSRNRPKGSSFRSLSLPNCWQ